MLDPRSAFGREAVEVVGDRKPVPHRLVDRGGDGCFAVHQLIKQLRARERRKWPQRTGVDGNGDRVSRGEADDAFADNDQDVALADLTLVEAGVERVAAGPEMMHSVHGWILS